MRSNLTAQLKGDFHVFPHYWPTDQEKQGNSPEPHGTLSPPDSGLWLLSNELSLHKKNKTQQGSHCFWISAPELIIGFLKESKVNKLQTQISVLSTQLFLSLEIRAQVSVGHTVVLWPPCQLVHLSTTAISLRLWISKHSWLLLPQIDGSVMCVQGCMCVHACVPLCALRVDVCFCACTMCMQCVYVSACGSLLRSLGYTRNARWVIDYLVNPTAY